MSRYLGSTQLGTVKQVNSSEGGELWRAEAELTAQFSLADRTKQLRCVVTHQAYQAGRQEVSVGLDILCKLHIIII